MATIVSTQKTTPVQTRQDRSTRQIQCLQTRAVRLQRPGSGADGTTPQARDQYLQGDWPERAAPQNSGGEKVRLSQTGPILSPTRRESSNCVNNPGPTRQVRQQNYCKDSQENVCQKPALAKNAEIVLAKITPLRYIAFTLLIRYVDIRTALTI